MSSISISSSIEIVDPNPTPELEALELAELKERSKECKCQTISQELYDDLVHYAKYASCAYNLICPKPNGSVLVLPINNPLTDIQGFIARDDKRKEVIVALRGSLSVTDFLLDSSLLLVPLKIPGVDSPPGTRVHSGFLLAYSSIHLTLYHTLSIQLQSHPSYSIITVGHSLGGALATLAGISMKCNIAAKEVRCYSYGSPRVGNKTFSTFLNSEFGSNSYRVVHTNDGAPTIIPTSLGYHHTGIEYWQKSDPSSAEVVVKCNEDGEDMSCSASIPSRGINVAHVTYLGIKMSTPFCW